MELFVLRHLFSQNSARPQKCKETHMLRLSAKKWECFSGFAFNSAVCTVSQPLTHVLAAGHDHDDVKAHGKLLHRPYENILRCVRVCVHTVKALRHDIHSRQDGRLPCSWRSNWPFGCDAAQAFMSLSELEALQHATHLGGDGPDGLRWWWWQWWGRIGRRECHKFLLEALIFLTTSSGKLR